MTEYNFILICSTGRSGSTTLQRIINTIPNTNIYGENDNAILHLLAFYKSIKNTNIVNAKYYYFVNNNIKPEWYNYFDKNQMSETVRNMIIKFLNYENDKSTTVGFKEIRYDESKIHLLDEFKELFPNTKIIFHIRNPEVQCKSSWWADNPEESKKILYEKNKTIINYFTNNKNNAYLSVFSDLFDIEKLKKMFVFLGKEQYFDQNKITEILNNKQECVKKVKGTKFKLF